ncbi:MAG: serine/threonine protein kinase [Archangium sp.]|nr:serine/threonine protein kinase [Archangium sp.]
MEAFEPGTRIADKYQLVRPIGRGGMGEVWEAVNDSVGKRVAIKLLEPTLAREPEFMRRFELEAQAAAMIDHPDIVDVLDTGTTDEGAPYMVMEFLQGITLRQLHKKFKQLTMGQTVAVIAPVLDALAAAHAAGIIHRDLKPANIFLAVKPRPSVKILDFGISKFQQSGDGMTKTGVTLGTPAYMAPEQVRDSRTAGPQADLYSVGGMLYALLSGRAPFEGDSDLAIVAAVLTEAPPPLKQLHPGLPEEAYALVDACLTKDVKGRPDSAAGLREQLLALSPPDDNWLFARVRELTPTESKPAILRTSTLEKPISKASPAVRSTTPQRAQVSSSMRGVVPRKAMANERATEAASEEELEQDQPTVTPPPEVATAENAGGEKQPVALYAGIGAVALIAIVALGWILTRPDAPAEVPAPRTDLPGVEREPPVMKQVELTLKAEPAEAKWKVGTGDPCNPCTITGKQGLKMSAKVSAEGFTDSEVNLSFDETRTVTVTLQPIVAANTPPKVEDPPVEAPPDPKPPVAAKNPKTPKTPTGKKTPKKGLEIDESNPYAPK